MGPISITSNSGGAEGYSIKVVLKLDANSTGTYSGFYKYGPQTNGGAEEWYDYGTLAANNNNGTGYEISDAGKTITIYLKDNVRGDNKLDGEDGKILDPGLLVVAAAATPTNIPTLSVLGLLALSALIGVMGMGEQFASR